MSKSRPIVPGEPPESAKPVRRTKRKSTGPKEVAFSNPTKPASTPRKLTERAVNNIKQMADKWAFGDPDRAEMLADETAEYVKNYPFGIGNIGPDEIATG